MLGIDVESDKPPLLYLPGIDGTGRLLYRQTDLQNQFRVHCESYPQNRPQTYEELADTAAANLTNSIGKQPVTVLAESFGGAVAITFALRHPELVERLLLINTFVRFPARIRIWLGAFFARFFPARPSYPWTRPIRSLFFMSRGCPKQDRDRFWKQTADVPMKAYGYRMQLLAGVDLRSRLSEIAVPTLVIAAPDDRVVPARAGREIASLMPNAKLIEPRVGHTAIIHPEINVAQLLNDASNWTKAE